MGSGKHEQVSTRIPGRHLANIKMLNTENMSEFYHLLTLQNGTTLNIPAGRSGFLTEPQPISRESGGITEMQWPAVVSLDSPRGDDVEEETDSVEYFMGRDDYNKGPECVSLCLHNQGKDS
jgi:hypothetical protein